MASDVWSYGVLMWEVMSYGKSPYGDVDNYTLLEQIQQGYRLEQPDDCPYLLYSLMLKCWDTVPEMRPTFSDLHFQVSFTSIEDWLTSLKMERYVNNFKKNGYSTMPRSCSDRCHTLGMVYTISVLLEVVDSFVTLHLERSQPILNRGKVERTVCD